MPQPKKLYPSLLTKGVICGGSYHHLTIPFGNRLGARVRRQLTVSLFNRYKMINQLWPCQPNIKLQVITNIFAVHYTSFRKTIEDIESERIKLASFFFKWFEVELTWLAIWCSLPRFLSRCDRCPFERLIRKIHGNQGYFRTMIKIISVLASYSWMWQAKKICLQYIWKLCLHFTRHRLQRQE